MGLSRRRSCVMRVTKLKKVALGAGVGVLLATGAADAESCYRPPRPDHDWTVRMTGAHYGLRAYGSTTYVLWGKRGFPTRIPIYAVAGLAALPLVGLCFFAFRGTDGKAAE